jgi:hypothetical protein
MAPFVVGDFIEYSGYQSGDEVVCFEITATNIQIVTGATTSNGRPAYIHMEDLNIGVFSSDPNAEVGQSKVGPPPVRSRATKLSILIYAHQFVGYTSDAAGSPLTLSAIDIDPCTGKETLRSIITLPVDTAETRLKFDVRIKNPLATDKYTREYMITTATASKLTKNNITAGAYVQPVTEWIQPELANPGNAPVANVFSAFTHLTQGLGPDSSGNIWGPLDPFPQSGVTVFDIKSCPPVATTTTPTTTPVDKVAVTTAAWISSGGGTLTVTCTSNNTNAIQVGMLVDWTSQKDGTTTLNQVMTAGAAGTWTFSNIKIKQPTTVTCHSKLGGSATLTVAGKKKRRHTMSREEDTLL